MGEVTKFVQESMIRISSPMCFACFLFEKYRKNILQDIQNHLIMENGAENNRRPSEQGFWSTLGGDGVASLFEGVCNVLEMLLGILE